jgi:hypothetical protein
VSDRVQHTFSAGRVQHGAAGVLKASRTLSDLLPEPLHGGQRLEPSPRLRVDLRPRPIVRGVAGVVFCVLFTQRGRGKSAKGAYPEISASSKHELVGGRIPHPTKHGHIRSD